METGEAAVFCVALIVAAFIVPAWVERLRARAGRAAAQRAAEWQRRRTMLYDNLSIAEAIVWGWEEMTEKERVALSLSRRAEIRKIREDLEKHKQAWGLE